MITMGEFNMKKISLVLACVAVVSVLVGCGGVSQSEYDTDVIVKCDILYQK